MNIHDILQLSPVVHAIGISLLHFLWQGLLVALLLGGVLALLKRSSPQVRYVVACIALLVMVVLPVGTLWHVYSSPSPAVASRVSENVTPAIQERPILAARTIFPAPTEVPAPAAPESVFSMHTFRDQVAALCNVLAPWIACFWLVGVAFLSTHLVGGLYFASILKRRYTAILGGHWQQTVDGLRESLGISRAVALLQSHRVSVPTMMGWVRPVVLLPASALTGLTPRQIEVLLAHELAHIRRYDYAVNLFQNIVETLLFYHPAVWWVSKRIRNERELCCDDIVLEVYGDARAYAGALAGMLRLRMQTPAVALAASGGSLADRIRRLLGIPQPQARHTSRGLSGTIVLAMLVALCATFATGLISARENFGMDVEEMLEAASAYREKADGYVERNEHQHAVEAFYQAIDVLWQLTDEFPLVPDYRQDLALAHQGLGHCLEAMRVFSGAEDAFLQAAAIFEMLTAEHPDEPEYRNGLAGAHQARGHLLPNTGQHEEADHAFSEAVRTWEELAAEFPTNLDYTRALAGNYQQRIWLVRDLSGLQAAVDVARKAAAYREQVLAESPDDVDTHHLLSWTFRDVSLFLNWLGQEDLEPMREAHRHARIAVELQPTSAWYRWLLADRSRDLAGKLLVRDLDDEAEQAYRETIAVLEKAAEVAPESIYDLARVFTDLARLLDGEGQAEEAEQASRNAERARTELATRFPNLPYEYRASYVSVPGLSILDACVDYTVRITSPGEYRLYVRAAGHDYESDSFFAWIEELADGPGGAIADWYFYQPRVGADFGTGSWPCAAQPEMTGSLTAATWTIAAPGDYTIRLAGFEDGAAIDAFVFQLASQPAPTGYGPEESPLMDEQVFLEFDGRVVVEAEHFTSSTPRRRNWLIVPDEDPGDVPHRNLRGAGYIQALPDSSPTLEQRLANLEPAVDTPTVAEGS